MDTNRRYLSINLTQVEFLLRHLEDLCLYGQDEVDLVNSLWELREELIGK